MDWPTAEMMTNVCPPGASYRYEVLRKESVAELIAALRAWQPGWRVGAASVHLREDYYDSSVFLEGGPRKDVFTMLIRHGDELAGMLSQERGVDKRVVEAAFVKCLAGREALLSPDVSNMTPTVRRLYEIMRTDHAVA